MRTSSTYKGYAVDRISDYRGRLSFEVYDFIYSEMTGFASRRDLVFTCKLRAEAQAWIRENGVPTMLETLKEELQSA